MKVKAAVVLILIIVVAGGAAAWQYFTKDPAEPGEQFLNQIAEQNFNGIENYFEQEKPRPTAAELRSGYADFGESFALAAIKLVDFKLREKKGKEAVFDFKLRYESIHFPPLEVESQLVLKRRGLLGSWLIEWADNLPLPHYGLGASYSRVRLEPRRAAIYDAKGRLLAGEGSLITVGVQPDRIQDGAELLAVLEKELALDPEYVRGQYEKPGVLGHWFVPLIKITESRYQEVDGALRPIPGIFFRRTEARAYPYGPAAAHLTGYLGEVTAAMIEDFRQRDYQSGEIVGRSGLEAGQDDSLRGRPGYRFFVEQAADRILTAEKPVEFASDLHLTIDGAMQELAAEILEGRRGAFVILNAATGGILALVSTPSYDPNEFILGVSQARWQELSGDLNKPMFNRGLQGLYPPGSVFKAVTAAAAIDQGLYTAESVFVDSGELRVEGNIIRNYERQIHGEHTLHEAIVKSVNTTVAKVALELGAPALEEYFKRWGLDRDWALSLPLEKGRVGLPGRSQVGLAWSALGQDQLLLTPLHVAQIFAVFANEGRLAPIHLIKGEAGESRQVLQPETAEAVNAMLQDVVREGTGKNAQVAGLEIKAKTGTAEVVGGGMHAWFAGHTELNGEKIAFALLVEEGGVGGQTAAPLVAEFFQKLIDSF